MQAYFFENQPNKILPSFEWKGVKRQTFGRDGSKITLTSPLTKEKERREMEERKKGEKAMVAPLVFITATLAEKNCWT